MLDRADGADWHVEKNFRFERICSTGDSTNPDDCTLTRAPAIGTLRHNDCVYLYDEGQLDDAAVCRLCNTIPQYPDFRKRLLRLLPPSASASTTASTTASAAAPAAASASTTASASAAASAAAASRTNDRFLGEAEIRLKAAELERRGREQKKQLFFSTMRVCYLTTRVKSLKEKTIESGCRGDVRKLVDDLKYCHDSGKLERKKVLLHFIMDTVHSLRHDGRGIKFHESTHRVFEILKHYGGPRTHRFVEANLAGMHLRTTEKRWACTTMS